MADARAGGGKDGSGTVAPAANQYVVDNKHIRLPPFIVRNADGFQVLLSALDFPALLLDFIDQTFESGMRFSGLDYANLRRLVYDSSQDEIARMALDFKMKGQPPILRLAADIVPFSFERRQFFVGVRIVEDGWAAEYQFEPITVRSEVKVPIYGEVGPDGVAPVSDHMMKTVSERIRLELDEFIAAMWSMHVRFGIDAASVKTALASNKSERVVVARGLPPVPCEDASIAELTSTLRRDDRPKVLAGGRIDLHQFQNHFPQVAKDTRLIQKIPPVPGKSGWDIAGNELTPEAPADINLEQLAGPGTRYERTAEGEFVIATAGGFLQIDTATSSFSICEKIVHREGVSLRTTGNLILGGDDYEEHGEVQELARVEGKHMTFRSDVYGDIVSHGGRVLFSSNLSAGSVTNPGGQVTVEGNSSRATIVAIDGEVSLDYAEGCLIVGKKVHIGRALRCDIVADELDIEICEGSALAARKLQIGTACAWRDTEAKISMQIPDLSSFDERLEEIRCKLADNEQAVAAKQVQVDAITSQQEVKNYVVLAAKVRSGELSMSTEQAANWQKLMTRVAPALRELKLRKEELNILRAASQNLAAKTDGIKQQSHTMSADITCNVGEITGETLIRTLKIQIEADSLQTLPAREIRACLHETNANSQILFNSDSGAFTWSFKV